MSEAQLSFALGTLSFSGQGSETWLTEQFDKVLLKANAVNLLKSQILTSNAASVDSSENIKGSPIADGETLVAFLRRCGATENGNKKFLATALWTMARQGKNTFILKDIPAALVSAQQSRLANPSTNLARVIKAGFVEQSSNGECYVTPDGKKDLGLTEEAE